MTYRPKKLTSMQHGREPACHDRFKRHNTDGSGRTLARHNHACDRLADMAVMAGRETELELYQPFSTQHATTSGGAPMTTDPYKEVAQCAASLLVQAILTQEYSIPPPQRKECTRFMRLTACGDVDVTETSKILKTLSGPLHDTAVQSILGRSGLTSQELASVPHCSGAVFICNIQKLTDTQGCPFCLKGPESRYNWRHECTHSRPGFLHTYEVISHVLAGCGPTLWFDTSRRLCASSGIQQHDYAWWASHNVDMGDPGCQQWQLTGTNHQGNTPTVTVDRCRTLQHHWKTDCMTPFQRMYTGCYKNHCHQKAPATPE